MAYTAWSVSFGEQPSAAKWNILGSNDAYFDGLVGSGTAWTAFTPTWTNLTVGTGGNALNTGVYQQHGKVVFYRVQMVFGTRAPSMGSAPNFVAPVTPKTSQYVASNGMCANVGYANLLDTGVTEWLGFVRINSSDLTKFDIVVSETTGTYGRVGQPSSTIPFTWAAGDGITATGMYEAA